LDDRHLFDLQPLDLMRRRASCGDAVNQQAPGTASPAQAANAVAAAKRRSQSRMIQGTEAPED
jgi:hypothetical protein